MSKTTAGTGSSNQGDFTTGTSGVNRFYHAAASIREERNVGGPVGYVIFSEISRKLIQFAGLMLFYSFSKYCYKASYAESS